MICLILGHVPVLVFVPDLRAIHDYDALRAKTPFGRYRLVCAHCRKVLH